MLFIKWSQLDLDSVVHKKVTKVLKRSQKGHKIAEKVIKGHKKVTKVPKGHKIAEKVIIPIPMT